MAISDLQVRRALPLRPATSRRRRTGSLRTTILWQLGMAASAVIVGAAAGKPGTLRLALALSALALAVGLATRAGPGLIYLLVTWTTVLGTVRRVLSSSTGANQADPLLLIAVGAIVVLTATAAERGAFRDRTRLGSAVLIFNVLTLLEALNPRQGSLRAGVTGLVFLLVPALAFWIGRGLVTERSVTVTTRLLGGLSIVVAIYGLAQTFVGFPPWDSRWIANSGYAALNVDKVIRAFGSFASSQEYALYLGVGIVVWVAYGFGMNRLSIVIAAVALLGTALFYESSRTPLVTTLFAIGMIFAATRLRNPVVAVLLGVGIVALLPIVSSHFTTSTTTGADRLAAHQISGLAHPFSGDSTLSGHLSEVTYGFRIMLHNPLGLGGAVINIAGAKAGALTTNTEYDPSNIAIALGVPGLLAYLVIVIEGFKLAIQQVNQRRDFASRVALGIIAVTFLEWTNGGLYSVAFLPWMMMGWLDGRAANDIEPPTSPLSDLNAVRRERELIG